MAEGIRGDQEREAKDEVPASMSKELEVSRPTSTDATDRHPLKIGVLISGSGTNLQALIDAIAAGELNAEIVQVISSRPDAHGLKRAHDAGIPTLSLSKDLYEDSSVANSIIARELNAHGASYVIMAGYMRFLGPEVLGLYHDRVVNLHPALLPAFPGAHAIADAFRSGVKVTGVTVHFANMVYDQGPIIAQEAVIIREDDDLEDLEARIHEVEHRLLPHVVQLIAEGRVSVDANRIVRIAPRCE